ncbi:vacuolar ATP synthase subunit S1-domain-containing protein [Scheffersomyces amazonensis]|uniref:vacuolar ATP synthase subunit S1-domain-containing protein n=1 Tax=Scheffersomyces amazonensis TaxID=1078765 RepID=UPI00315CBD1C
MKFGGLHLVASVLALSEGVVGFSDTASFYSSIKLNGQFDYITEASVLSRSIQSVTNNVCRDNERLIIYRVKGLSHNGGILPEESSSSPISFIKHVHYNSPNEIDFEIGESCNQDSIKYVNDINSIEQYSNPIVIVDVEDDHHHKVEEFLTHPSNIKVIVQGKPKFHSKTKLKDLERLIEDKLYEHLNIDIASGSKTTKRDQIDHEEEDFDKIIAEVEEDFRAAESFIAEEGDSVVSIFDDEGDVEATEDQIITPKATGSNLFTNYQFFSSGIWSGLIVSGFLLFVLYNALSWISTIEVSYGSFDKQIDFEKKNE